MVLIKEAKIDSIRCPDAECNCLISNNEMRKIGIQSEYINKLEEFSINKALDNMEDFTYCPLTSCAKAAYIDKNANFGECTICEHRFCL